MRNAILRTLLMAGLLAWLACQKEQVPRPKSVAVVADPASRLRIEIDEKEFLYSYEFTPSPNANLRGAEAKKKHLDLLIDKKLLTLEGFRLGLDSDEEVQIALKWYREKAIRQKLYQEVVQKKVTITDEELREAFTRWKTRVRVRHLPAATEEEAWELRKKLLAGATFQELSRDRFKDEAYAANGGDLGWVRWGQLDENFEKAMYTLPVGEISKPVRSRWAYHIIKVENRITDALITESEFHNKAPSLRKILSMRKQEKLANQFVQEFMRPKRVRVYGPSVVFLAEISKRLFGDQEKPLPPFAPRLYNEQIQKLQDHIQDRLNDVLVVFEGGQWTIGDFLQKLRYVHTDSRPVMTSKKNLKNVIARMVRDEFLLEEGYRRGLHRSDYVRQETEYWREELTYLKMKKALFDTIQVTEKEIREEYERRKYLKSYEEVRERIAQKILEKKQIMLLRRVLAQLRQRYEVQIDEDRLLAVRTTDDIFPHKQKIQMFGVRIR